MSRTASAMAETICPPHIEGRHPMLYFNIQSTEKYSIAMCYQGGGGGVGEPVGGEGGGAEQEGEGEEEQGGDKWVEEEQQAVGDPPQRGALR